MFWKRKEGEEKEEKGKKRKGTLVYLIMHSKCYPISLPLFAAKLLK